MKTKEDLLFDLKLVDKLAGVTFGHTDIEIYLAGGSACILADISDRATRDFDFVDLGYPAKYGKLFKLLEPYDLLTVYFAAIPKNYASRAIKIEGFENISVYIFSTEDIIASKIDRLSIKDIEDIRLLLGNANQELLKRCIEETYLNIFYEDRKSRYAANVRQFYKIAGIPEGGQICIG